MINAYKNNYYQHIKHITINKCFIGFQKRKLLIVIACRDYNIVFKILLRCKVSFYYYLNWVYLIKKKTLSLDPVWREQIFWNRWTTYWCHSHRFMKQFLNVVYSEIDMQIDPNHTESILNSSLPHLQFLWIQSLSKKPWS